MRKLFCLATSLLFLLYVSAQTVSGNKSLCGGNTAILTVTGVDNSDDFIWQFSADGNDPWTDISGTNNKNSYTANKKGFYRVKVTSNNKTSTKFEVVDSNNPTVSFVNDNDGECSGTTIKFTPTVSGGISPYTYAWTFDDGVSSTSANPAHAFIFLGCSSQQANNSLVVTDANGCSALASGQVKVLEKPDVQLGDADGMNFRNCDNSPTISNPTYTINVDNISPSSCIKNYSINWGDGNTVNGLTNSSFPLTHTYTLLGAYNMVVTAIGNNNCSNTKTYVVANQSNPAGGLGTLGATTNLCAPADIPFVISNWENNSPGTSYILDFGDGQNITLNQPLSSTPGSYTLTHTYTTSSCTFGSGTFVAYLNAINACSSTPYSAGNIQINTKAEAKFNAPVTGCVNQSICFSNQTTKGYVGSGCSTTTKYTWDFGDSNSTNNTSSDENPCHTYNVPGIYTVTLTDENKCGTSTATQEVCVLPVPIPSFTLDKTTGCGPVAITATNTSNTLTGCAASKYEWTITYDAGGCGTSSSYDFTNGTDASSVSPAFNFKTAGNYTIQLSITNPCGTFSTSQNITITQPPVVGISPVDDACGTASISPSATVAGCSSNNTYSWSFPGGSPSSSPSTDPGIITYSTSGTYIITLQVTNGCGTTTATKTFAVNPLPSITVPASSSYCSGTNAGPFNFTSSPVGTITWTNDNTSTGLSSSGTGNIAAFPVVNNSASNSVSHVSVTTTANGCPATNTFDITVYPDVPVPATNAMVSYCIGQTATQLTATAGAGNSLLWYTVSNGGTGLPTAPTPDVTKASTTHYYVSQTSTAGNCESGRAMITVTVNAVPTFTATSNSPTQCGVADGSIQLKNLLPATSYTIAYTQDGANKTLTQNSDGGGIINIDNLLAGLYEHLVVTANNCPSAEAGPFLLKDPTSPETPTITGGAPLCSGNTLTLSVGEINGASYAWTGPNNYTNTTAQLVIPNTTLVNNGPYSVTVTVAGCRSEPATTNVVINPTPVITANSNSPLCSGSDIKLLAGTSFTGELTWQWSGPNGYNSGEQNPVIQNAVANTTPETYSATAIATTGNCSSLPVTTDVTVHPTPVILSTSKKDPSACATTTGSITLHTSLPNTSFTVHYIGKGNPVSIVLLSDGNGDITITGLLAGSYDHIYIESAGCSSTEAATIILSDPNPPAAPTVSSNTPLCAQATLNLKATSKDNGTYTWSGPNSFASNDQNPVVADVTAANAGTYHVTITVNNCTSLPDSTIVIVNLLAPAPVAATPVEYCFNTTAVPLTATAINGGTVSWYNLSSGGTPLATAPTPSTATAGSVFYYASQTSMAGCEGARTAIEVVTHPDAKALFSPLQTTGCSPFVINSTVVNLQPFPDNNSNYQWFANNVLIGSGASFPGYTIQNDHDSVTIKLKALSLFGCRDDSAMQKFYTYQLPKTAFTASNTGGCGPLTIAFTNKTPEAGLFKFKWLFGNGETSTDENPPPVVFATNPTYGDTTYHVTLLGYTVCDTITATTDILIKSKPKALFAPDKTSGCSPMMVQFANISKGFGTNYQWFFGDGATQTTTDASAVTHTYITGIQDTFYAKMVATNDCGTDTSLFAIVVSPNKVKLNVVVNGNQTTGCAPHTVQFINRSSGAAMFDWNFGDGNTLNTTANIDTVPHTFTKGGTYTVTLFASNGCSDTSTTETITVFDKPKSDFNATPVSACIGDSISFTGNADNYTSLLWQFGDAATSVITDPQHAYQAAGSYNAVLIAQKQYPNGTVCSDTAMKPISIVDKLPGAFSASETVSTCVPFTVTFTNTTLPSVLTTWTFTDGTLDTGDVVTHTFVLPGTYTVAMQAKHPAGCLYEANKQITVKGPAGSISYTSGYVCNNTPVRFESNTTNTDSVYWNFGDGLSLITKDRVIYHVFRKPGIFVPSAELVSGNGCRVSVAAPDTIKVDYIQAGFSEQQDVICGTTTLHFTDTSGAFFGLHNWQWNLGDGTTSTQQNPVHDYAATGTLPLQLIAISNSGCADTATVSLPVKVDDKPAAAITGPATACDATPVPYNSSVSSIDSISFYQWTITGNALYNTADIAHTFPGAGNYNIQLIAGTVYGCYDTINKAVTVNATPAVTASGDITICNGTATSLTVTGNASQYNWQQDASLSCTACASPMAAPSSTTQYYVTGTSPNGCSRTDSVLVSVVQPFTLTVSAGDSICIGQSKQLTVSGASQYSWSPSATLDDSTSQHPVATPLASTIYSVTGTDAYHCFTQTQTVVVGVGNYPTISLGMDTLLSTGTIFPLHSIVTEEPIQTYNWLPAADLSCSNCPLPDVNIKKSVCYTVTATSYYGCSGRDTVCIKVFCESSQVFIPNIFTPDGDGVNDKLIVQGKGISLIRSFRIFNRWGQVVFEKSGFLPNDASSGWDGKVNGNMAAPDVYVYTCEVVCDDGTVYPYKGNVAIVK